MNPSHQRFFQAPQILPPSRPGRPHLSAVQVTLRVAIAPKRPPRRVPAQARAPPYTKIAEVGNPRSVKKFINTLSVLGSVRTLEENFVESETLALWALLLVRWPELADRLQVCPEAVTGITQPLFCSGYFPPAPQKCMPLRHLPGMAADS